MDIKEVEKYYQEKSDEEIVKIATKHGVGLRPEVFGIIENEIKKRNLDPNILNGAIAQNTIYTYDELDNYAQLLQNLPCPKCYNTRSKLNATVAYTIKGLIYISVTKKSLHIACPNCSDKISDQAIRTSLLLGWWSIPGGIIKTPIYLYKNYREKKENNAPKANTTLLAFTLENIGFIETYKDNKEKLMELIELID